VTTQIGLAASAAIIDAGKPTRARIGGGDEHEARRELERALSADDRHMPVLKRLAQRIEAGALKLRKLV
jgi:hypothetical protein